MATTDFFPSFVSSFSMIILSEIGDKTFIIAATLAMKYNPLAIFTASFLALLVMTVLSAALGYAVPNFLSAQYTHYAAVLLFIVFGLKMLKEASEMSKDAIKEEMEETSHELLENENTIQLEQLESGRPKEEPVEKSNRPRDNYDKFGSKKNARRYVNLFNIFSPIFVKTFGLTFLAEWGDRSQIATVAMAADQNVYGVTLGASIGHCICTLLAVLGGRYLSSKISLKTVTVIGGILFIFFGMYGLLVPYTEG